MDCITVNRLSLDPTAVLAGTINLNLKQLTDFLVHCPLLIVIIDGIGTSLSPAVRQIAAKRTAKCDNRSGDGTWSTSTARCNDFVLISKSGRKY